MPTYLQADRATTTTQDAADHTWTRTDDNALVRHRATTTDQSAQDVAIASNKAAAIAAAPADVVAEIGKVPDSRWDATLLDALAADLNSRDETAAPVTATYDAAAGTFTVSGGGAADNVLTLNAETAATAATAVVDDDATGGATLAWSAERGKQIRADLAAEILATDAEQAAQDAALAQEVTDRTAADLLKVNVADRVGIIRDALTAENTKWADELAIRTLIDSLATGQRVTPFAATFATLQPVPADASATKGYLTILTTDDVGAGTAVAPEFPSGIYVSQATAGDGWAFGASLGGNILAGIIEDFDDPVEKAVAKTWKGETLDERFLGKPSPLPVDGSTLSINTWYQGRTGTYIIPDGTDGDFVLIDNPSNLKGEATRPSFTGRFSTSSNGAFFNGTLSVSPNGRWRLYWDSSLDGGGGAWRIHSNRSLIIPITYPQDGNLLLTRNNDYALYNSAATSNVFVVRVPKVPSGRIRIRYDNLSTGPMRIEMEDGSVADNISYNGLVGSGYDFDTSYKGQEISVEANTTTGHWVIYTGAMSDDTPIIDLAADNKPIAYQARRITADTTLDLADVPATEGVVYSIELMPGTEATPVVLTVPGIGSQFSHTGPNAELLQFVSTGTAGELRLLGNESQLSSEFFREYALNGAAVTWTVPHTGEFVINENVTTATNNALITTITNTTAGGTTYTSNASSDRLTSSNLENTATVALTAGDVLSINALSAGGTTSGGHTVRIRPVGGVIQPNNEPAWTPRTLTYTIDGGAAVTQTIYDDAGRWVYLDPGTDRRFVEKNEVAGAAWATSGTGTLDQTGPLFIQAAGNDITLTLTTEAVPVQPLPTSFSGWFSLTSAHHYFTPTVSGNYKLRETLQNATNNALLTTIRRKSNGSQVYTSNLNRITNANQVNEATLALLANVTYEIDPASGGGTTTGSHSLTLILDE